MKVSEIKCKTILTPSNLPGSDYTLNPYIGCTHDCAYCYAVFMNKWHKSGERWGKFVEVKANAPEVLEKQLERVRMGSILISSVCDPYQPVEEKYEITRQCLGELIDFMGQVSILTKSNLFLRDLDILKRLKNVEVGVTLTNLDEEVSKIFETGAPNPRDRLAAIETLIKNGLSTYVFVGPIIPYFGDKEEVLEDLFQTIEKIKVNYVLIDKMNYLEGGVGQRIKEVIKDFESEVQEYFEFATTSYYARELKEKLEKVLEKRDLNYEILF